MRKEVTTKEYIAYRDKTHGCLNVKTIHYTLKDVDNGQVLLTGKLDPSDEARQLVLGKHPSGNWHSSVVGAALDLFDGAIKSYLRGKMSNVELENVPIQQTSSTNIDAQGRRVKAITWAVVAIDEDTDTVWVEGVI